METNYKVCTVYYQLKVYIITSDYFKRDLQWIYFKFKDNNILISNNADKGFYIMNIDPDRFNFVIKNNEPIKIYFETNFLELINETKKTQDKLNQALIWEILQQKIKEVTNEK